MFHAPKKKNFEIVQYYQPRERAYSFFTITAIASQK